MKALKIVAFFILFTAPMSLFAQQSGGGGTSSSLSTDFGSTYQGADSQGVENVSAQGGFIGSGIPSGFVGIDDFYYSGGSSNANRATSARRQTTATRATVRPTAQRRTTMASGAARSNLMGNNTQSVRAVASVDFDVPTASAQARVLAVDTVTSDLKRIQGFQDGQITLQSSPTGTTAVLTGTVASKRERDVAKQLLLLEPGISRVDNLLEIR